MTKEVQLSVANVEVTLLPERAVYLPSYKILVIADLHLGKATHFQRHGLPIPGIVTKKDLERLDDLLVHYSPANLVIAGDLFHASHNNDWEFFIRWKNKWNDVPFNLVKGNHDRLKNADYLRAGLIVSTDHLDIPLVRITHIPSACPSEQLEISGHIHPGISLRGRGHQKTRVPCFVIREKQIILPAFSHFTGLDTRFAHPQDEIYAVVEDEITMID